MVPNHQYGGLHHLAEPGCVAYMGEQMPIKDVKQFKY